MAISTPPEAPTPQSPKDARAQAKAAKAYAKASRPFYKKKRFIIPAALVAVIAIATANSGGSSTKTDPTAQDQTSQSAPAPQDTTVDEPAVAEKPSMTASQENAVKAAENYISFAPFSEKGLVRQLSSKAGDGYPKADAEFAVKHIDVNWNEQAVKAAKNYLDMTSFSRDGLIRQLSSSAGDGYTHAQAVYAANKVGL